MMTPLLQKYFKEIAPYTACVMKGAHAGRVGEVSAITNAAFAKSGGLAYLTFETGRWVVAPVEVLQRV